ncbi:MAG: rhomboid family intramembrane serine protease [archaeon]|nr:rhomboid family intramembrane serine protease [archaeon]
MVYLTGIGFGVVNLAVYGLWKVPKLQAFMMRHFTLSLENIAAKRYHTMLSYAFSHQGLVHLSVNTAVAFSFGGQMDGQLFDRAPFAVPLLFLSGSVAAGWGSLMYKRLLRSALPTVGASGGAFALLSASLCAFPDQSLLFVLAPWYPIPGLAAFAAVTALDVFGMLAKWRFIDHAGHLSGSAAGAAFFYALVRNHPHFAYNGTSTRHYADGAFHHGHFHTGKAHGQGTRVWKSGAKYTGAWINGKLGGGYGFIYFFFFNFLISHLFFVLICFKIWSVLCT